MLRPEPGDVSLRSVRLRGTVEVDPMVRDPMLTIVEERQRVKRDGSLSDIERKRLGTALKVVGNAGSYGIYSEFNARTPRKGERTKVEVFGRKEPFFDRVPSAEDPGRYCFPPFASWITGAARLMLAMLERCVTDLGGTWVFCDTDSMAIVTTRDGGLVACPGGPYRFPDGRKALTSAQPRPGRCHPSSLQRAQSVRRGTCAEPPQVRSRRPLLRRLGQAVCDLHP